MRGGRHHVWPVTTTSSIVRRNKLPAVDGGSIYPRRILRALYSKSWMIWDSKKINYIRRAGSLHTQSVVTDQQDIKRTTYVDVYPLHNVVENALDTNSHYSLNSQGCQWRLGTANFILSFAHIDRARSSYYRGTSSTIVSPTVPYRLRPFRENVRVFIWRTFTDETDQ